MKSATSVYDEHVRFYVDFVDRGLADKTDIRHVLLERIESILGERLVGARVCDIACGEGYLSRLLERRGPAEVVGVDKSTELVGIAQLRSDGANLQFRVDDACRLATFDDGSTDIAVSQLAIMDIEDHRALFRSVHRVLRAGGAFVFSLLHPCFEGPFRLPDEPQFQVDADGGQVAVLVRRYASEGFWRSGGSGVRGHMGAYHRTLSTLINDLLAAGFTLERIDEPIAAGGGLAAQVPRTMLIAARR